MHLHIYVLVTFSIGLFLTRKVRVYIQIYITMQKSACARYAGDSRI